MSLGTITKTTIAGLGTTGPLLADVCSFPGDSSYPTGGSTGFQTAIRAKYGDTRTILAVIGQDCGGYQVAWDPAAGKLMAFYSNSDAADGPLIEVPNATNLSGVTFHVLVIAKLGARRFAFARRPRPWIRSIPR